MAKLIKAYLTTSPLLFSKPGALRELLQVVQSLLDSDSNNHEALRLAGDALVHLPPQAWTEYLSPLARLVAEKAKTTNGQSTKFGRGLLNFLSRWVASLGVRSLVDGLISSGLGVELEGLIVMSFLKNSDKLSTPHDARVAVVAMCHLLTEAPNSLDSKIQLLESLLWSLRTLNELGAQLGVPASSDDGIEAALANQLGYSGGLQHTVTFGGSAEIDPVAQAGDLNLYVSNRLREWFRSLPPQTLQGIMQALTPETARALAGLGLP